MRLKHNKKRNVAFVYEALVRELTKNVVKQNKMKAKTISSIIIESFKKGSLLHEELNIYKSLYEAKEMDTSLAKKIIMESKIAHEKMNKNEVFAEQTQLIKKINKLLGADVFSSFVPNYKSIATVHSIFNNKLSPKNKVLMEEKILENMTASDDDPVTNLKHIDDLVFKTFVSKFNEKYKDKLLEGQKKLLVKYISSFEDNGLELKVFLNEELGFLKQKLNNCKQSDIIKEDTFVDNIEKVEKMIDSFKKCSLNEDMIRKVIKIQKLVSEMTNED